MDLTRENLIKRCEKSLVDEKNWLNRDSKSAQAQVGELWALLKDGCEFEAEVGGRSQDDKTIAIDIFSEGFAYHEHGGNASKDHDRFYLPTKERIEEEKGRGFKDWY